MFPKFKVTCLQLVLLVVAFWMVFANRTLFEALLRDYPLNLKNALFLFTAVLGFAAVDIIVLSLFCWRRTIKPILIVLLLVSSQAAYYMDTYNLFIDDMLVNTVLQTDAREVGGLISLNMLGYFLALGVFPSIIVYRATILTRSLRREILSRAVLIISLLAIVLTLMFFQSAVVASFFREHKPIRFHANPASYVFSLGRQVRSYWRSVQDRKPLIITGSDARIPADDVQRELVIMVVGETARADRFSLNGYARKTNPLLEKQDVVSFRNVRSCATLTALSVPCMFSNLTEKNFSVAKADAQENVLDVMEYAGAQILWRDNNSSSKNVADRAIYEDFRSKKLNTICDDECRDEGMLVGLPEFIAKHPKGDIVIVLHSMGNHGPAYYQRYPRAFAKFKPECMTNELSACTSSELNNSYDNAVLYTDYFLNKVIEFLKKYDGEFETSMLYVSDHGESLGENNVYLHGLPNFLAPIEQRHVPMIMWIGKHNDRTTISALKAKQDRSFSHDNIFHTLLGLLEIKSKVYDKSLDLTRN